MDVAEAIRRRRSIRRFASTPVGDEALFHLLESARLAPSASNKQPWRFVVVQDSHRRERLYEACFRQTWVRDAPVVLVCLVGMTPSATSPVYSATIVSQVPSPGTASQEARASGRAQRLSREAAKLRDAAIAVEHISLQAVELGLGTCWIGMYDEQMVKHIVKAPDEMMVAIVLSVGYPAEDPPPRRRLSLSEIAFREEFGNSWPETELQAPALPNAPGRLSHER